MMIMLLLRNIVRQDYCRLCLSSFSSKNHKNMDPESMIKTLKSCIPPLDGSSHKGQAGRIGIVGGSLEYTGAPYFAGISALKVGADLVHIFCTTSAATVIKSYSPELIVHPLLDKPDALNEISPWLDRLHAIVIGPGLGREASTFQVVSELIKIIQKRSIPIVIDADGIFLITEKPELIANCNSPIILTPNKVEYERLSNKLNGPSGFSQLGPNVTVLSKGIADEIISLNPEVNWKSNIGGSGRRCGGQGDILSGAIAIFAHWTTSNLNKCENTDVNNNPLATSLACYGASSLTRRCNEKAFKTKGRSMLAGDMIEHIHESFEEMFGQ